MTIEDNVAPQIIDALETSADYRARRRAIAAWNRTSPIIKRGIALTPVKFGISFTATHYNQAGALIHVYQDGTVLLNHGGTEMGQGLFTKVQQVVAHELGVALSAVRVSASDTSKVPNASPTAASSGSDINGMLAGGACAGLAGVGEAAGPIGQLLPSMSPGYGFAAIIVAFVGRLHPAGIVLASLLMSLLYLGGESAQVNLALPSAVTGLFQGTLLFFLLAADVFVNYRVRVVQPAVAT